MKKIKLVILAIILQTTVLTGLLAAPTLAYAQTAKDAACEGVKLTGGSCDSGDPNDPNSAGNKVNSTVGTVINIFSWIVGVAAVIMIIIGGFRYITSGGDSGKIGGAKDTILYAIIGLVVVAMAQIIVRFVLNQF